MDYLKTGQWIWERFSWKNLLRAALILSLAFNGALMAYVFHLEKERAKLLNQMTVYFKDIQADKKETERELKRLQRKVEKP